jgi:hypothetical protein
MTKGGTGHESDGADGALGTSSGTGGLPAPKRKKAAYIGILRTRERFPGSPPARRKEGWRGSEAPHDPGALGDPRSRPDEPTGGGPGGLREGQNAQDPL